MTKKDEAARRLIDWHFSIEPEILKVYRFISPEEESPEEPIKLIEISTATFPTGRIDLFGFGPAGDVPYSMVIATVTPEEWDQVKTGTIPLPNNWDLKTAKAYSPSVLAHATG